MGETTGTTNNKTSKTPTSQESPSPPVSFSDWHAAVQAYYPPGAALPGYFPPPAGTAPPYPVWNGQPMMPPYGTPPPYGAMYPPGMYGHPYAQFGMASPGSGNEGTTAAPDAEGKSSESKGKSSRKRSKERGTAKATSGSAVSQSCDSDSEGSSDDNDDEKTMDKKNHEQTTTEASSNMSAFSFPYPGSYMTGSSAMAPMTNLNIGMDYWSGAVGAPGKRGSASTAIVPAGPRDGAPADLWIQDERELKRQRRKQSNRESARRSRLRKQMECEELGHRVDDLTVENMKLRADIDKFREEIKALTEEHTLYLEQLQQQQQENSQQEPSSPQSECDMTNSRPRVEQRNHSSGKASTALQNLPEAVAVG